MEGESGIIATGRSGRCIVDIEESVGSSSDILYILISNQMFTLQSELDSLNTFVDFVQALDTLENEATFVFSRNLQSVSLYSHEDQLRFRLRVCNCGTDSLLEIAVESESLEDLKNASRAVLEELDQYGYLG